MTKATSFTRVTRTPSPEARSSSSRMASSWRPKRDRLISTAKVTAMARQMSAA